MPCRETEVLNLRLLRCGVDTYSLYFDFVVVKCSSWSLLLSCSFFSVMSPHPLRGVVFLVVFLQGAVSVLRGEVLCMCICVPRLHPQTWLRPADQPQLIQLINHNCPADVPAGGIKGTQSMSGALPAAEVNLRSLLRSFFVPVKRSI